MVELRAINRRTVIGAGAGLAVVALSGRVAAGQRRSAPLTFIAAGIDARENYGDFNSDVLVLARVDLDEGELRAVSIPRDLYVPISGFEQNKINRAFDIGFKAAGMEWAGGAELLTATVERAFGIDVDGIATTPFEGFRRLIDIVGGIEVDNPYEVAGDASHPIFPAGVQMLDGDAALAFVRTRSQDGDDGRVMRQQLVLAGLLRRLQDPDVAGDLPGLLLAARETVQTDIPVATQLRLLQMVPSLSADSVSFSTITQHLTGGMLNNGMWVYQADCATLPGIVQAFLDGSA